MSLQLTYLKIEPTLFIDFFTVTGENRPLRGTVEFSGTNGKMSMNLTPEDIENIQQLLMSKTKDLASEV